MSKFPSPLRNMGYRKGGGRHALGRARGLPPGPSWAIRQYEKDPWGKKAATTI